MRVSDSSGVYHDGDAYRCPDCSWPYASAAAAASCDCGED